MNEEVKPENVRIHSRADELIACLEGEIAKRDARIMGLESQYQRDVWGLNNEGDPIGGEPAGVDGCKCSMSISMLGDGCRHCQPQEYIDRLGEMLDEERSELSDAQAIIDGLRGEVERSKQFAAGHVLTNERISESLHAVEGERDQQAQRIGELEGLLREVHDTYRAAIHWEDLRGAATITTKPSDSLSRLLCASGGCLLLLLECLLTVSRRLAC